MWKSGYTVLYRSTHRWPRPAHRQDFSLWGRALTGAPNLGFRPKQKPKHRLRFENQGIGEAQFLEVLLRVNGRCNCQTTGEVWHQSLVLASQTVGDMALRPAPHSSSWVKVGLTTWTFTPHGNWRNQHAKIECGAFYGGMKLFMFVLLKKLNSVIQDWRKNEPEPKYISHKQAGSVCVWGGGFDTNKLPQASSDSHLNITIKKKRNKCIHSFENRNWRKTSVDLNLKNDKNEHLQSPLLFPKYFQIYYLTSDILGIG